MTIPHQSPNPLLRYSLQHQPDTPKDCYAHLLLILNNASSTFKATLVEIMQFLIYFTFLELSDDLHIFLTDGIIFEIIEFGCIVGEIKKIDASFMIIIEFSDIFLDIEVMAVL